ncbi:MULTISPECIES: class I SAM-dependent methyltransferase [unclassified Chelatococcus]|uniref:class I SAM-dependent methyltransferase n=1 Tax=unclassified Chelatococcus TaxID=2638111 RepID=UPI0020BD67CF|nr:MULTISPECIES: class I SAM-dependent methyltransferase [unclassified Chelatococcus]
MSLATTETAVYQNKFRRRRLERFLGLVDEVLKTKRSCRVLDVGGGVAYWKGLEDLWSDRPLHITLVNLTAEQVPDSRFLSLAGDACSMPGFDNNAFDIVHSNSVLEHVGSFANKRRMADEIQRLAPRHFVQTPNFWFPIEPHFRTPAIHWLPEPLRVAAVMRRKLGFYPKAETRDQAYEILSDASLLDVRDMQSLFPASTIEREKFYGFTKSLIAVRG